MGKKYVGLMFTIVVAFSMMVPVSFAAVVSDFDYESSDYYLVHFSELPNGELRNFIEASGIEFQDYMNDGTYLVKSQGDIALNGCIGAYANGFEPYTPAMKLSSNLAGLNGAVNVRVQLHDGVDVDATVSMLEGLGATIHKVNKVSINYIRCNVDASMFGTIAGWTDVKWIDEDPEPITFMDQISSNTYMGIDTPQSFGFTGTGMLAEVQDNGIDRAHPDLANIIYTDGSVSVDHHGTCTSGIVFGNGAGDIKALGCAPDATGVFADWYTGRAVSVANLWNGNFNEGSAGGLNGVVQSNSWSQGTCDGLYQTYAEEDDQAMYDNPKVLTLWAAANSNDGTQEGRISEDSAAKNVMCIGAIFHQDTADMSDDRYELYSNGNTPSRGPAADGRQKPDMCGNFDWIYTTDCLGTDGYVSGDYWDDMGGTSGATPEVAGSALLAYEMYQENYFDNNPTNEIPYSSTIKALMIANAHQYPLTGTYSATRTCQGWGTPDMEYMYDLGATYHQIDDYPQALDSGDTYSRNIYSDGAYPLKITLCWTDPAAPATTNDARALRNNLDLKVTSPGGVIYWGNNGLWDNLYSSSGTGANQWGADYRDDLNNVENVFVENPQSGIWTIEIIGRTGDVAQGPQDFSLVASGAQIPITSQGMIQLDADIYAGEDTAMIMVMDSDLNTNTNSIQTVTVNVDSDTEPAGESVLLTETGFDTAIFEGTLTLSATDGGGILQVSHNDIVTATYDDDDDGSGPATVTDTAIVDAGVASTSGLTVDWWGVTNTEDVVSAVAFVRGTQVGTFTDTYVQDDSYHQIVEATSGGGGRKNIDFQYTINIDPTGTGPYSVNLDAYTTGETFTATYSTNGGASWGSLGTITATSDTDTYSIWGITASPGNTVLVDITGTSVSFEVVDTLYVDHLYILGGSTSDPTDHNTLNWTLSGDDGAGMDDVVQYNIYRANNPGGPWDAGAYIDNVAAGTDTYTDLDRGIPDGIQWWYVVRAEDGAGNEDSNSIAVPEPGSVPDNPPVSSCSYSGASPTPDNPVTIDWTATDAIGLTQVELFYQFDGGGYVSWSDGTNPDAASGTSDSGSWSFDFLDGAGTYDFYTRATDDMPQTEGAPGSPDVTIEYVPIQTYNIDLTGAADNSWVFVSFPISATGDVMMIFDDAGWGDGGTTWDMILWFDPSDDADHWKSYNINYPGIQDMPNVDNTMGVWVHLVNAGGPPDDVFLTVGEGFDPSGTTINLVAGWNMVGFPSQVEGYTAGDLKTDSVGLVTRIERFNDAAAYDIEVMPDGSAFQIGQAYWVYATAAYAWVIP